MRRNILNDISNKILLAIVILLVGVFIYNQHIFIAPTVNATELIINYKGCIVVNKKDFKYSGIYNLTLRNPYTNIDKDIRVLSGLYFNYYIGDTIGTKKQVFNFN